MASKELITAIDSYEDYIRRKGEDEQSINAFVAGTQVAFSEKDIDYALKVSASAKQHIENFVLKQTGGTVWDLEKYAFANKTYYDILEKHYSVLKCEAQNKVVESYFLYLEKNREPRERFYAPKRKQFAKFGLVDAYQGMLDDKYDILCISMVPGSGKAQPLYSKVLTPNGFIRMGDVKVGTKVISGTGNVCNVVGVYPQGVKEIYEITLENGDKCRCSADHLWNVRYNYFSNKFKEKTVELNEIMFNPSKYLIPVTSQRLSNIFYLRVGAIEKVGEEECQCIYVDDESHLYITDNYIITHNTTMLKFFNSGVIGWFPKDYNLFYSHSGDITRMYYDGVYQIVSDSLEYTWHEIFPDLQITSTNAKMQQFNIGSYKPFPSLQTAAVGSENAGKVRASKFLLVDDMIGKLEEALNKNILEKLWGAYTVDARQRKTMDSNNKPCKEIIQATRWSTLDPIGRVIQMYDGNERVKVISIPDIDPVTGESNFDYEFQGFTVDFFNDQALLMDDISYRCLYKQEPIEREGLLYHENEVRRYSSLPDREPDAIIGVCDTKSKGIDYMVLPCFYQYDNDFYMVDCVCDNTADYAVQYKKISDLILEHKMQQCEFESNAGGDRLAHEINKIVEDNGGRCNITTKATETNKETRIIVNSDWIKKHCLFKSKEDYTPKSDYGTFMNFMFSYSIAGKNKFDDVCDCLANFALYITKKNRVRRAIIMESPI